MGDLTVGEKVQSLLQRRKQLRVRLGFANSTGRCGGVLASAVRLMPTQPLGLSPRASMRRDVIVMIEQALRVLY